MDRVAQEKLAAFHALEAAAKACAVHYPKIARTLLDLADEIAPVRYSADGTSARLHGKDYVFTRQELAAVNVMRAALARGTPWVQISTILRAVGTEQKSLSLVFRHKLPEGGHTYNPYLPAHILTEGTRARIDESDPEARGATPNPKRNPRPRAKRNR